MNIDVGLNFYLWIDDHTSSEYSIIIIEKQNKLLFLRPI